MIDKFISIVALRKSKKERAEWLFLVAGWLALLAGCVVHSHRSPMWVDELYSFDLIQDPSWRHMLAASGDQCDGSPPLYYFFVRPWAAIFGLSETSLRLFSSTAFCVAFTLVWKTLRRVYAFWPAAISLALVIGTSHVIRFENCNVRFYGLLFALVALAAFLAVRFGEQERPGWPLFAANTLTQAALVLCHPLGGFYGVALCAAVVLGDWLVWRRPRWFVALSYPLGWLALAWWFPQILRQADLNRPHSWVSVPTAHDLPGVLYGGSDFYPLFLLVAALTAWRVLAPGTCLAAADAAASGPFSSAVRRQWLIALALIGLPFLLWVFSILVPSNPLFLSRYVIGVSIGWTIILAQLATLLLAPFGEAPHKGFAVILCAFAAYGLSYLVTGPGPDYQELTGESDAAFDHFDLPIVCLRSHDFLPREHYSAQADRYYFLLDWEVAAAPGNSRHATVEYKILDALRRNYAGLFHHHIVPADEFLRDHSKFLVHEVPHTSWVAKRLTPDRYTVTRLEADRSLDYTRDGVWPLLLVERKNP